MIDVDKISTYMKGADTKKLQGFIVLDKGDKIVVIDLIDSGDDAVTLKFLLCTVNTILAEEANHGTD